jgi:hypothetical protein
MKRPLMIIFPIALLILINACNNGTLPKYSPEQWTAIAKTQQVMGQSKTERIKRWLSKMPTDFDKFDLLEQGLVGKYEVTGVGFPTDYYFEVDMNCECTSGSSCCDPERMFFLIIQNMAASQAQILADVPTSVQYLDVVCLDHNIAFYAMYAPWDKVKNFLSDPAPDATDVTDLISNITRKSMP